MAEFPAQMIGVFVVWEGLRGLNPSLLLDALCAVTETTEIPGIADLKPEYKPNTYLSTVRNDGEFYADDNLDLFTVAGQTLDNSWFDSIISASAKRLMSEDPNDWVVPLASSGPRLGRLTSVSETVQSNHFGYFDVNHSGLLGRVTAWLVPESGSVSIQRPMRKMRKIGL